MDKTKRIVITGIGPLTAAGSGSAEVWNAVANKKTGLTQTEYKIGNESGGKFYVHKIKNFDIKKYGIKEQALNEIQNWKIDDEIIDLYYFLAVIKMALDDTGLEVTEDNKHSIGMVLMHENIGLDHFYLKVINELSFTGKDDNARPKSKKEFLDCFYGKFHRTGYELQTFMSLHHAAKVFDIHGYSLFINNACASGLYGLEAAADAIRSGKCSQMVVSAVDNSSIFKHMWFDEIKMLAKDGRIKPFASDRDGFTIGDGGAALVLESMESAEKRKAKIYAEYLGGNFVLEGWKVTYPDVANQLYKKMIHELIELTGFKASDIDLIVPHGVAANITDKYEAKAIRDIFGKEKKMPLITALKPYIGHTLGSTALLETAIMLLGLENNKIPATLNCNITDKALGIDVLKETRDAGDTKIAMKTACGFAGYDGGCVFRVR